MCGKSYNIMNIMDIVNIKAIRHLSIKPVFISIALVFAIFGTGMKANAETIVPLKQLVEKTILNE